MNLEKIAVDQLNDNIRKVNNEPKPDCRICSGTGIMLIANFPDDVDREPCHCVT